MSEVICLGSVPQGGLLNMCGVSEPNDFLPDDPKGDYCLMTLNNEYQVPFQVGNYTNDTLLIPRNKAVARCVVALVDQSSEGVCASLENSDGTNMKI